MTELTENNFFDGSITVFQKKNGYRFSLDPILLAAHVSPKEKDKILDIGTGSGIIPISLAYRKKNIKITGVEIQKPLYEVALKNIEINNLLESITLYNNDIKNITQSDLSGPVDIIVTNPPYRKTGTGRLNPESEKAVARHEIRLDIDLLLKKTKSLLKNKGRFYIIYPASRAAELICKMEKNKIAPKEIRFVHSFQNSQAVMVIIMGISNGNSGVKVMPPLFIYEKEKIYTKEVLKIME